MKQNTIVFDDTIAKKYDDLLGPFVFEPYAADLVQRIDFRNVRNVLEIAAGTGRVTKHLSDHLPKGAKLVATDINPGMLDLASHLIPSNKIEWKTADMMSLPFEDEQFDLVVIQFGVMFAPDKVAALKEIRRVLRAGGQLVFNTWGPLELNQVWHITSEVVNGFMEGRTPNTFNVGPFNMSDKITVLELIERAGFNENYVTSVTLTGESDSTAQAAKGFIEGLPILKVIQDTIPESLPAILEELEKEFVKQLGQPVLKTTLNALVFQAVK